MTCKFRSAILILTIAIVLTAGSAAIADTLYGADGAGGNFSNLYILNPSTGGVISTVGPIGYCVTGLAIHPTTGVLYGSTGRECGTSPGSLITIDRATGAGTVVGRFGPGVELPTAADLTFTSDGNLYGWIEPFADDLALINTATGEATVVGDSGLSTQGSGLAGDGTTFFLAGEKDDGCLHTIDRVTGTALCGATLNGTTNNAISSLAFDGSGTLFGVRLDDGGTRNAELITINPVTGAITVVGPSVNRLDAIVFAVDVTQVPEPATVLLLGFGLAACGWVRRRRLGASKQSPALMN